MKLKGKIKGKLQRELTLVHAVVSKPAFRHTVTTTYCENKQELEKIYYPRWLIITFQEKSQVSTPEAVGVNFVLFLAWKDLGKITFFSVAFFTDECETVIWRMGWPGNHLSRNLDSAKSPLGNEVSISQPFWALRNLNYIVERFKTNIKEGLIERVSRDRAHIYTT